MRFVDGCRDRGPPRSWARVAPGTAVAVAADHRIAALATFAGIATKQTGFAGEVAVDAAVAVGESCVDSNRASIGRTVGSETDCRT